MRKPSPYLKLKNVKARRNFSQLFNTFCCLLLGLFFQSSVAFAQSGSTTDPTTLNCTANDIKVDSAVLVDANGVRYKSSDFVPGNTYQIYLQVNFDVTAITRYGFLITGAVLLNGTTSVPFAQCYFPGTDGSIAQGAHAFILSQAISWTAGTSIQLTSVFTAWQNQTGDPTVCSLYDAGVYQLTIKPHCKYYGPLEEIPVVVPLIANFSSLASCTGSNLFQTISFTNTTIGGTGAYIYLWHFGDGGTSADASPSHTYTTSGDFTVTLTVTDQSIPTVQTDDQSYSVTVASCCQTPNISSSPSSNAKCIGGTASFTVAYNGGSPTPLIKWQEDAGSGFTDLTDGGIYSGVGTATLTITGVTTSMNGYKYRAVLTSGACTPASTDGATLTVNALPVVSAGAAVCVGSTSTLSPAIDGTWISSDNTIATVTNAGVVTGVSAGNATFTFTQTSTGCSNTTSSVTVNGLPDVSAGSAVCVGNTITLSPTTGGTWTTSSNNTIATVTIAGVVTGVSAGNATFTFTQTSTGCSNTTSSVKVNPVPSCTISNTSNAGSNNTGVGQAVNFSGPAGTNFAYQWSFTTNTAGATFTGGIITAKTVTVTTTATGSYTLSLKVTDNTYTTVCNATCSYAVAVNISNAYYSVTQGFYGNVGGKICTPTGGLFTAGTKSNVPGLIYLSIQNMGGQLKLGITPVSASATTRTFIMGNSPAEQQNLITYLPAGQTPTVIIANSGLNNNTNIGGLSTTTLNNLPKIYNKKISDILLGQTITLAMNVNIPNNTLGSFGLKTGYLTTQKADLSVCPVIKVLSCATDVTAISSLQIAASMVMQSWIVGKTVTDLLNLASNLLGGAPLPAGVTLADVNNAVDVINKSFDGGRFFLGYYINSTSCGSPLARSADVATVAAERQVVTNLSVAAYPNPFTDRVKFAIVSPVSGKASLDVYNMVGQKLRTVYTGYLFANKMQVIDYSIPAGNKGSLIYTLKVGNQHVNGKVIQLK